MPTKITTKKRNTSAGSTSITTAAATATTLSAQSTIKRIKKEGSQSGPFAPIAPVAPINQEQLLGTSTLATPNTTNATCTMSKSLHFTPLSRSRGLPSRPSHNSSIVDDRLGSMPAGTVIDTLDSSRVGRGVRDVSGSVGTGVDLSNLSNASHVSCVSNLPYSNVSRSEPEAMSVPILLNPNRPQTSHVSMKPLHRQDGNESDESDEDSEFGAIPHVDLKPTSFILPKNYAKSCSTQKPSHDQRVQEEDGPTQKQDHGQTGHILVQEGQQQEVSERIPEQKEQQNVTMQQQQHQLAPSSEESKLPSYPLNESGNNASNEPPGQEINENCANQTSDKRNSNNLACKFPKNDATSTTPTTPSTAECSAPMQQQQQQQQQQQKFQTQQTPQIPPVQHKQAPHSNPSKPLAAAFHPKQQLNNYFLTQGLTTNQLKHLKKNFTTWFNEHVQPVPKPHERMFVCVFTCPLTGEHFASGNLKGEEGNVVEEDGVFWYKNKNTAMTAAAAKAVDCFTFRASKGEHGGQGGHVITNNCNDSPFEKGNGPTLPRLPRGMMLSSLGKFRVGGNLPVQPLERGQTTNPLNQHSQSNGGSSLTNKSSRNTQQSDTLHQNSSVVTTRAKKDSIPTSIIVTKSNSSYMQKLYSYYTEHGLSQDRLKKVKQCYSTRYDDHNKPKSHEKKFTCLFTCPMSGERFACGHLKDLGNVVEENGLFWYQNTKSAMNAAAAKALDCFAFRNSSIVGKVPSYNCLDDPYLKGAPPLQSILPQGQGMQELSPPPGFECGNSVSTPMQEAKGNGKEDGIMTGVCDNNQLTRENGSSEKGTGTPDMAVVDGGTGQIQQPSGYVMASLNLSNRLPVRSSTVNRSNVSKLALKPPKQELNEFYTNMGLRQDHIKELKSYYMAWHDDHHNPKTHERKYTCVFTCPITGEHFACGYWENPSGVVAEGSVFWYQNTKLAMNAAAARALDCFSYRECIGSKDSPALRCQDTPYLKGNGPPLPSLPSGSELNTNLLPVTSKKAAFIGNNDGTSHDPASTIEFANNPLSDTTSKQMLYKWYEDYWRRMSKSYFSVSHPCEKRRLPGKEYFSTWSNRQLHSAAKRFTTVFTCPWTGERFFSGKLVNSEMLYSEENSTLGEGAGATVKKIVWYCSKKEAENAAAGRALDCLLYRSGGRNFNQYCSEPPSDTVDSSDISQTLSGVTDLHWEAKGSPVRFKVAWKCVPVERRIPIRFGAK